MPNKKQDMPEATWPISKDDKVLIQALGRKLNKFLFDEFSGKDSVHLKIVVGAFNYVMDLQSQKSKLIADDFIITDKTVTSNNLTDLIEEPFTVEPDVPEPTRQEKKDYLISQLQQLEAEEEIENASPAPSASEPVSISPEQVA